MNGHAFIKMHGLGNDFVVMDTRVSPLTLDDRAARAIADRHSGVGCDQLILIEPPRSAGADAFMTIRNADGDEVEACGNATRCVATLLMREKAADRVTVETVAGLLPALRSGNGAITVDMGPARDGWRDIPLARDVDTLHVPVESGVLADAVAVNVGNPHAVFFTGDAAAIALAELGPGLEHHAMFPKRANIGVAEVQSRTRIRLRVWERGVGITRACGSGACAALVAAARRGLTGRQATVVLDGGPLDIAWRDDGHVLMTGPVATSFSGVLDPSLLA